MQKEIGTSSAIAVIDVRINRQAIRRVTVTKSYLPDKVKAEKLQTELLDTVIAMFRPKTIVRGRLDM